MDVEPVYFFAKDCRDFEGGNEVQAIVSQYDAGAGAETFFHPVEIQISPEDFFRLTGERKEGGFCGMSDGVVFWFDPELDVHFFYTQSGSL